MIEKEFHAAVINENIIVHHLKFLKIAYNNDDLRKPHYLANAIRRYETLWLPLMVKIGKLKLYSDTSTLTVLLRNDRKVDALIILTKTIICHRIAFIRCNVTDPRTIL